MTDWLPPERLPPGEILVVACTDHYFSEDYVQDIIIPENLNADIKCHFSNDPSLIKEADALWFHGPSIHSLPKKNSHQKWIVMSMESDITLPFLGDSAAMSLFDIHMTYKLSSDVPTLYPNWHEYDGFLQAPVAKKEQYPHTLFAASNPVYYRDKYVAELMRHIHVDSVGKCLNNKIIPGFTNGYNNTQNKSIHIATLIKNYKYYLAFENSHTQDYVTEKVFHALAAGTIPIYSGAKNVLDFMPHNDAIINIKDFNSPEELAKYLLFLDQNDDEYQKHLAWKTTGYSADFKQLVDIASIDPLQRMFIKLAHGCGHECGCGGRLRKI